MRHGLLMQQEAASSQSLSQLKAAQEAVATLRAHGVSGRKAVEVQGSLPVVEPPVWECTRALWHAGVSPGVRVAPFRLPLAHCVCDFCAPWVLRVLWFAGFPCGRFSSRYLWPPTHPR